MKRKKGEGREGKEIDHLLDHRKISSTSAKNEVLIASNKDGNRQNQFWKHDTGKQMDFG